MTTKKFTSLDAPTPAKKPTRAKKLASTAKQTTKPTQSEMTRLRAHNATLTQENEVQRANLHEAGCHIQALQNTITQLRDEANVMRGTITSQVREAELHGHMIKNREDDKARLVHDLTSARNEVIALQKKLTIQESVRVAVLETELECAKKNSRNGYNSFQKEVDSLKEQVRMLKEANAKFTNPATLNLRDMFPNPNMSEQKLQIIAAILGLK